MCLLASFLFFSFFFCLVYFNELECNFASKLIMFGLNREFSLVVAHLRPPNYMLVFQFYKSGTWTWPRNCMSKSGALTYDLREELIFIFFKENKSANTLTHRRN